MLCTLTREEIVAAVKEIVGEENVATDLEVLQESTYDRFRKFEGYHKVFTNPLPAAVVYACSVQDVSKVLQFCNANRVPVVPRTGHSATEGGLEPLLKNSIVLDGSKMNRILKIDEVNMQVTCQCGVCLQTLEDEERKHGLTTGHSPQSKPIAQMGGLVATRSIGQFSTMYGGIEDTVTELDTKEMVPKMKLVPMFSRAAEAKVIISTGISA